MDNENALFYAVKNGNIQLVESLIYLNTNVNVQNSSGDTPLLCACSPPLSAGYDIVVKLLNGKANPNIKNGINDTPLCCALCCALDYNQKDIER